MWDLLKPLLGPILDKLVDRIPDPNERTRAREEAERQLLQAVTSAAQGQMDVNKVEAAHKSLFVAGWRPGVGWICVVAIGWHYVGQPITASVLAYQGQAPAILPTLQTDELF